MKRHLLSASVVALLGAAGATGTAPPALAGAASLSPLALFYRCYHQITQTAPNPSDPLTQQVVAGQIQPIDACLQVLDSAKFTGANDTTLANTSDPVARSVLKTFHSLHASWFTTQDFTAPGFNQAFIGIEDLWDATAPAFYFDEALFVSGTQVSTALTGSTNLRAVRTGTDAGPAAVSKSTNPPTTGQSTTYIFGTPRFAPVGPLLGVQPTDDMPTAYPAFRAPGSGELVPAGTAYYGAHFGGGILGSTPFLLLNVGASIGFQTDGGVAMPRKWSHVIFRDLLCRDLPVVRAGDVPQFVDQNSSVPFRTAQGCVQCHATIDRTAMTLRNFTYLEVGPNSAAAAGADFPVLVTPTLPAETVSWSSTPDPNYYQRPPNGVLYYRDLYGNLVDVNVSGIAGLGQELANHDDFYMCVAKRYYQYFMGVDVTLADPDPAVPAPALSGPDAQHLSDVMALGKELRAGQSTRALIEAILRLPTYADSSFGANP